MDAAELILVEAAPLPYLLSLPGPAQAGSRTWPLLFFLHGHGEGAPSPLRLALTLHGPLSPGGAAGAQQAFILAAPQLPMRGDHWRSYAGEVSEILQELLSLYPVDRDRLYLTGFSFGGNGVFDLALEQPGRWAALWPVDPTRVPAEDPGLPVWLSLGQASRGRAQGYIRRLSLEPAGEGEPGERVYLDEGLNHEHTARKAYRDGRIYRWLLSNKVGNKSP